MSKALPARPNLDYLKKLAKQQLKSLRAKDPSALLATAQLSVARDHGFKSWQKLQAHVKAAMVTKEPPTDAVGSLERAIDRGDERAVRTLLDQYPALINMPHTGGRTPLHFAAERNDPALIVLLLERGADVEARYGHSAHTPLSWAITMRANAAAESLVQHGTPIDLYCSAGLGLLDQVRTFFDRGGRLKPGASTNGSSRFDQDGTRLPRPPVDAREVISDALYNACRNGHADTVRFLLKQNPDLSFRSYIGGTLLHWAYFSGSKEVVHLLLKAGADSTSRDDVYRCTPRAFGICVAASWGILDLVHQQLEDDPSLINAMDGRGTPLHEAARSGEKAIVEFLLNAGADPTLRDADGRTPLDLAVEQKKTDVAEVLKTNGEDPADEFLDLSVPKPEQDHRGGSLEPATAMLQKLPELRCQSIYSAAVTGSPEELQRILKVDKSLVNEPGGPRNWPPLCYLTFSRFLRDDKTGGASFVRCAKLLLDAGADPNSSFPAPNDPTLGETCLYGAAGVANHAGLTKLLLDAGADPADHESLYHACEFSDNAALRVLLRSGLDKKWISYNMCHKMDMEDPVGLKLFIDAGADVNYLIERGQMIGYRPLHFALSRGRSAQILKLLLDAGADPNLPASNGTTPYKTAIRLGRSDAAKLMLDHGANSDLSINEKFLTAMIAGDRRTVRSLIGSDNSLMQKLTADDHRLLVDAAAAGNISGARLMLDSGFPVETRTPSAGGWNATALHFATWHGHVAMVRLLLQRGGNPLAKQEYGGNALGTAIHGSQHAGHRNGSRMIKLIAAAVDSEQLREHLEKAKKESNAKVVKLLEQIIRDRSS